MKSLMGCLGMVAKLCAVVLALVLVLALPLSLGAHDLGRVLSSPATIADLVVAKVVDSGVLRRLVSQRMLSGELFGQEGDQGSDFRQAMSYLEPAEVDAIVEILLPPNWAGDQITASLESLNAWLDNDQAMPDLMIDVRPLRDGLLSGGAERLVEIIVDSWPACSVDQVNQMNEAAARTGEAPVLYCEPPEPYRSSLTRIATDGLTEQIRGMPARVALAGDTGLGAVADPAQVMAFKETIRMARMLAEWGWILPLSLLGVIMALVVRSWRGLARWWGIPLLAGGLLSFLLLLVGGGLARQALVTVLATGETPEALGRLLQLVGGGLLDEVGRRLFWHSLLLTLGAAVLIASGFLFGRKKPAPLAVPAPAASNAAAASPTPRPPEPPPTSPADRGDAEKPSGMFG